MIGALPDYSSSGMTLIEYIDEMTSRLNALRGITGDEYIQVEEDGNGFSLSLVMPRIIRRTAQHTVQVFKITDSDATGVVDADGNSVQWTYDVSEATKGAKGYGKWTLRDGGFTGLGYNFLEDGNDGTGRQQTGIDHNSADYRAANWQMQRLQTISFHPGILVRNTDSDLECWLMPYSGEDGTC